MRDDYHTGIRTVNDIRTYAEAWQDEQRHHDCPDWGDFTHAQALEALNKGAFVTTSFTHALQYAGADAKGVKTACVPLDAVAWIDLDQGIFTGVETK